VFFFQAEYGIRVFPVTGVQTCALPISCFARCGTAASTAAATAPLSGDRCMLFCKPLIEHVERCLELAIDLRNAFARGHGSGTARSEERRVGKGCSRSGAP